MENWKVDLRNTKDYTLLGDIGEAITLHYLSSHGFFIVCRPIKLLHGELSLISAHYQIKPPKMDREHWLTDKQKEYLEIFPSWDYVAFKRECAPYPVVHKGKTYLRVWRSPYLIEVKTVKGEAKPHKKPKLESISKAKSLGFKPMLIIVRLLENWNFSAKIEKL
jgi:hypothetical protein